MPSAHSQHLLCLDPTSKHDLLTPMPSHVPIHLYRANHFFGILNTLCKQLRKVHYCKYISDHLTHVNRPFGKLQASLVISVVIWKREGSVRRFPLPEVTQ